VIAHPLLSRVGDIALRRAGVCRGGKVSVLAQCGLGTASAPGLCARSALDNLPGKEKLWKLPRKTFSSSFSVLIGFPRLCMCSLVSVDLRIYHPDLRIT